MDSIISFKNVTFSYRQSDKPLLDIESIEIAPGEAVLIKGPSGCGKSTLINLITGILKVSGGKLFVCGKELANYSNLQRDNYRGEKIGLIFQQFNLVPYLSAKENIYLPLKFQKQKHNGELDSRYEKLAGLLNIKSFEDTKSSELSLGMQQRVAAARALLISKDLIVADEPTSSLDRDNADALMNFLFKEVKEEKKTLVVVSHDERIEKFFSKVINLPEINKAYKG